MDISANKLAEFIIAGTPARRTNIIRQQIHKKKGYAPFYSAFKTPAKRFLEGRAQDAAILTRAIERMKARTGKKWLSIDSRITTEAFVALRELAPELQRLDALFMPRAPHLKAKLDFPELHVTVTPDMIVHGERNGVPLTGSMRFYLAKDSAHQLGHYGAELIAVMQHQWNVAHATGERSPDTSMCIVIECLQKRVTSAPPRYDEHLAAIEQGARELVELWHFLERKEAA